MSLVLKYPARFAQRGPFIHLASYLADFNAASLWASVTVAAWFAFAMVPVQVAVTSQLGLSAQQASSSICIVWLSAAVSSVGLALRYRQPITLTWSTPGLLYLGTLGGQFSYPELVGASLLTGLVVIGLGVTGVAERILRALPVPLVMGVLAGSVLSFATRLVKVIADDGLVVGGLVGGYLVGRLVRQPRIPPIGLAVVAGGLTMLLGHREHPAPIAWTLPVLLTPAVQFSLPAFLAVSLPLVVLLGPSQVQHLSFLMGQGYRVPVTPAVVVVGITSFVNALLGGHPATLSRDAGAIIAAPEAGPVNSRYWAVLIAAGPMVGIALAASVVASLLTLVPPSFIVGLAGLAMLSPLQSALEKSFASKLQFGSMVAFIVAATPFTLMGMPPAFWAFPAAILGSLAAEPAELFACWRQREPREPS